MDLNDPSGLAGLLDNPAAVSTVDTDGRGAESTDQGAGGESQGQSPGQGAGAGTPSPDDRIAALEAQLFELGRQGQGGGTLNPRDIATALVEANAEQRRQWEQEQAAARALTPPTWTEDEKARILADPDLLYKKVLDAVKFGHQAAVAQLLPKVRAGEIVHQISQRLVDATADWALEKAKGMLRTQGLDPRDLERDDILQATYAILQEASSRADDPQVAYTNMTLDPRALTTAAMMARTRVGGGPPVGGRRSPAPTVGTGTPDHTDRRAPARRPDIVTRMETTLGHKFTDAELKAAAEKARRYDDVL